jgi:UDP-glucose 4-epimerase
MYPVTKIVNELFSRHFSLRKEVDCVSLRYFNTYGPGENTKGAYASPISKFISSALKGKDIEVFGDGTQSRDFIYVKDTAAASIAAYEHGKAGESYNVGTGVTTSFNEIAELVKSLINSKSRIVHVKNPFKNYQMFTKADMTKTFRDLDFRPTHDLTKAIREIVHLLE